MNPTEPLADGGPKHPFTTRDGLLVGIGRHQLETGAITRLTRGVHVVGPPDERSSLRGLLLVLPRGSVFSCPTAACIWSLPVVPAATSTVHVWTPSQVRRTGIQAHVGSSGDTVERDGLPVTTPVATFLDLAVHLEDRWLLAFADALVRSGHATTAEVVSSLERRCP
jgi:hypothetical protein